MDRIALEIAAGERVLVAGPTGSGKSTLLRALMGIVPHISGGDLSGGIEVAGLDVRGRAPHDLAAHGVTLVAQDPAETFVADRVAAEVAFGPESLALPEREVDARVETSLAAVGLAVAGRRRVRELSGGEQQRLAIAAALALRPTVLLMDEPTAHLDEPTARAILELVAAVARERGMTLVVAEHRLGIAARLATRAVVVAAGRIVGDGDPRGVLGDPAVASLGVPVPRSTLAAAALSLRAPLPLTPEELAPRLQVRGERDASASPRAAPAEEVLRFEHATYAYPSGERPAVRGVSFVLGKGERAALVGPTGSGKSTVARLALGVRRPQRGRVALAGMGTRVTPMARLAAAGGLVLQDPVRQLIAERVDDEIASGLAGLGRADRRERVERELERFGLAALRARHPLTLSEGERRRVVLATAIARRPAVLVLDEPTLGQDGRQRDELARLVLELAAEGTGVLVISHDPEFVADSCERAIVLREGALVADLPIGGSPEEIERLADAGVPLSDVAATARLLSRSGARVVARSVEDLVARAAPAAVGV
ncbi:MAG: ATP-binding cassette domain-containing protein [Chloroflexota bacterium]|nr:ATP-binding cassette domain-containing protein [Chloroflexota bacterium]